MSSNHLRTYVSLFFFNDTATTEIYTLSLHDALPFWARPSARRWNQADRQYRRVLGEAAWTPARELAADGRRWATPIEFGPGPWVPPVGGRGVEFRKEFWWLVGRWLGDGCVRLRPYQPSG